MKRFVALLLGALLASFAEADIIRASLLVMDPGGDYFSCTGHSALRLESEAFKLDRCFSYESEPMGCLLVRFLSGRLKMGMFRVPTKVFLEPYALDRRGVRAYRLDLPQDVLQALWMFLDEKVDEGIKLPYDYLKRGCSQSVLQCIKIACERCGKTLVYPANRPYFSLTCREAFGRSIPDCPWTFLFLHLMVGTDADADGPPLSHIYVPADLLDLLRASRVDEKRLIADDGVPLVPSGEPIAKPPMTPTAVALAILLMVIVVTVMRKSWLTSALTAILLTLCTAIGLASGYTVFCTSIPGTTWNWLLVPFNPLPLLLWRWRHHWVIPYCVLVTVWTVGMLLAPHTLTHPAYLVLAAATALGLWGHTSYEAPRS